MWRIHWNNLLCLRWREIRVLFKNTGSYIQKTFRFTNVLFNFEHFVLNWTSAQRIVFKQLKIEDVLNSECSNTVMIFIIIFWFENLKKKSSLLLFWKSFKNRTWVECETDYIFFVNDSTYSVDMLFLWLWVDVALPLECLPFKIFPLNDQ